MMLCVCPLVCKRIECYMCCRGEASDVHSKADLIKCAKEIAASAQEMLKLARQIANDCTDKRLKAVRMDTWQHGFMLLVLSAVQEFLSVSVCDVQHFVH